MEMDDYHFIALTLRNTQKVPSASCASILMSGISPHRFGALIAGVRYRPDLFSDAADFESQLFSRFPEIAREFNSLSDRDASWHSKFPVQMGGWKTFADRIADESISDGILGFWLMAVLLAGLSEEDVEALTLAMLESGQKFDYRDAFPNSRLIRRYPTGALSEKVALIMPTVISWCRSNLSIEVISPYFVARVLGHTGGTWDKLSVVPGFQFPSPGSAAIETMAQVGVAYVVTHEQLNPADKRLYRLRSETDTIESEPLIVSSIASKMLACPVHRLQLDVRVGTGAFFKDLDSAISAAKKLTDACTADGMNAFATIEDANFPTGSSIGSHAEIAEAIEVLGGKGSGLFDPRGIWHQRLIVADFSSRILSEEFEIPQAQLYCQILAGFQSGAFHLPFVSVFELHGVDNRQAEKIWNEPLSLLGGLNRSEIFASTQGRLSHVDQVALGRYVNERVVDRNIVIQKRLFDSTNVGDIVAYCYSRSEEDVASLNSHFGVS